MTSRDLLYAIGAARDNYLLDTEKGLIYKKKQGRPRKLGRTLLIAAILISLLAATAFATGWFGLRQRVTEAEWSNEQPPMGFEETDEPSGILAMNGYKDSPEALAAAEWMEVQASYIPDDNADTYDWPDNFSENAAVAGIYGAFNQTMLDELFRIQEKYDLKLHTEMQHPRTKDLFYKATGLNSFLDEEKENINWSAKYIFEDGSFRLEGSADLNGKTVPFGFSRNRIGTLAMGYFFIWGADDYEEWQYNVGGTTLNLALQQTEETSKGFAFAEQGDWFFTLDCGTYREDSVTREDLETLTSLFDYDELCRDEIDLNVLEVVKKDTKPKTGLLSIADWMQTPEYLAGSAFQHVYNDYIDANPPHSQYVTGQYWRVYYAPFPCEIESLQDSLSQLGEQYDLQIPTEAEAIIAENWVDASIVESMMSLSKAPDSEKPASQKDILELIEAEPFLLAGDILSVVYWDNGAWQGYIHNEGYSCDIIYVPKGSLCPAIREQLHPDAASWAYETACGEQVVITLDGDLEYPRFQNAIVLYETDTAYVVLQLYNCTDSGLIQTCADLIDFTKLK